MRLALVINPVSGRAGSRIGAASEREALARRVLGEIGVEADVAITRARGHGAELARDFVRRAYDRVIAWGGDGTVNEVAGPLIGTNTALGIVASGSGDGLAHGVGVKSRPEDALAAACRAPVGRIDVGWFGDRHFLNVAGVGFDAAVATRFNELKTRGPRGYVTGILSMIWRYRAPDYRLTLGDTRLNGPQFLVAFSNGREYGNRLVLSAGADLSDGWLDAVVVESGSPWSQLWKARRLAFGAHRPARGIRRMRVQQASVSGDDLACHVDGETFTAKGTIEVRIQPKGIGIAGGGS